MEPHEVQQELQNIIRSIRPGLELNGHLKSVQVNGKEHEKDMTEPSEKWSHCKPNLGNYKKRTFIIPFLLVCFSFLAGNFSGITTLTTFAVNIFATLGAPIDKYLATMILGIAQLIGTTICVILIHYTGKRPLVFVSTVGSAICFFLVGFYAHFSLGVVTLDNGAYVESHKHLSESSWIPMTCLIGGSFLAYLSLRLLPWILIGEVYPTEVRAFASGASASVGYISGFASNKTFFTLVHSLTLPGVYWFYGLVGLLSFVIFYFFLPETEGWSLYEVEQHFAGERNLLHAGKKKVVPMTSEGIDNPCMVGDQISKL